MGNVIDPGRAYPRTVSVTWGDPCDVKVRAAAAPIQYLYLLLSTERRFVFSSVSFSPAAMSKSMEL